MKIVIELPPNIEAIYEAFPFVKNRVKEIVFTYGNILYNPGGNSIMKHLMVHEETHQRQQGKKVEEWWNQYLTDKSFRLNQEAEAYNTQYKFIKALHTRQVNRAELRRLAKDLSGPTYGNLCSFETAKELISL